MKLQRALKEAIAPQRRLGPVRAPPICSMKLPRSSLADPDSASLRPLVSAGTPKAVSLPRVGGHLISRALGVIEWFARSSLLPHFTNSE